MSYVEAPLSATLRDGSSIKLDWIIRGVDPVFAHDSPGNTCPGAPSLSLLLHRAGDDLAKTYYRWFTKSSLQQPLQFGLGSLSATISIGDWIAVDGTNNATVDWAAALANIGSIGFVFGGGCFAGHGVSVNSGTARFDVQGLTIQ